MKTGGNGEIFFGRRIGVIRRQMRRQLEAAAADHDITATQFQVLRRLWSGDGLSAQWLAREADVDAATMTGVLDRLQDKGLVRREKDATDKRSVRVMLTPKGGAMAEPLMVSVQGINEKALLGLTQAEQKELHRMLDQVQQNLEAAEANRKR